jgi:hypothetical protein
LAIREIAVVEALHYAADEQPRMSFVFLDRDHMHVFFSNLLRPLSALAPICSRNCVDGLLQDAHLSGRISFLITPSNLPLSVFLLLGVALRSSRSEKPIDRYADVDTLLLSSFLSVCRNCLRKRRALFLRETIFGTR